MKILLVSFHFPPEAPLPATRAPKLAKHLIAQGHDVRVLCASEPGIPPTHALEIDPWRVVRTPTRDLRAVPGEILDRFPPCACNAGDIRRIDHCHSPCAVRRPDAAPSAEPVL